MRILCGLLFSPAQNRNEKKNAMVTIIDKHVKMIIYKKSWQM